MVQDLLTHSHTRTYIKTHSIIQRQGENVYFLAIVMQGQCEAILEHKAENKKAEKISDIVELDWIGSIEFMDVKEAQKTEDIFEPPVAQMTIRTKQTPCEIIIWEIEDLQQLFEKNQLFKTIINSLIAFDLAKKLQSTFLSNMQTKRLKSKNSN